MCIVLNFKKRQVIVSIFNAFENRNLTFVTIFVSFSVDIWSVGCITAEMLTSKTLFPGTDRKKQNIQPILIYLLILNYY